LKTLKNFLTIKNKIMALSTCCGGETTMTEIGLCPICLEHCDWEEEDEEELLEDQKTEDQINELQINKNN
jgi:hypothetical protein